MPIPSQLWLQVDASYAAAWNPLNRELLVLPRALLKMETPLALDFRAVYYSM